VLAKLGTAGYLDVFFMIFIVLCILRFQGYRKFVPPAMDALFLLVVSVDVYHSTYKDADVTLCLHQSHQK
jgi:hypothetical protein